MFKESGKRLRMLPDEIVNVAAKFLLPPGEIKHTFFFVGISLYVWFDLKIAHNVYFMTCFLKTKKKMIHHK